MILVDLSSVFHKSVHGMVARLTREDKQKGKETFIDLNQYKPEFFLTMLNIICEHVNKFRSYGEEVVLCLDNRSSKGNWRKRIYPMYKHHRRDFRQSFKTFDFGVAYKLLDEFQDVLKQAQHSSLFRVIEVDEAEADDIILVLGKYFADQQKHTLILSPDKDFIQLQTSPLVKQYSWMTNKFIVCESQEQMEEWLLEHVCLGDISDNVPRIVDFKEFRPGVREFLLATGQLGENQDAWTFSTKYYESADFDQFGGVFEREKFGISTLKKQIESVGGLETFLDQHPVYRKNYYRNRQLVLEEGIPNAIREKIIQSYESYDLSNATINPATTLVNLLKLEGKPLPEIISNKYISEQQLSDFLDW